MFVNCNSLYACLHDAMYTVLIQISIGQVLQLCLISRCKNSWQHEHSGLVFEKHSG